MKTYLSLLASAAFLIGCSSVSDSIPTVKIEKRKSNTAVQTASYVAPVLTASHSPQVSSKDAASVCETESMRRKVLDGNDGNDSVRIMVIQDSNGSSELLSEAEINCRDYFLRKSLERPNPVLIQTSTKTSDYEAPVRRETQNSRFTYIVQRGDTVWDIARQHCTSVKAISRLNGLGRGNVIDIGQRLKMPDQDCD